MQNLKTFDEFLNESFSIKTLKYYITFNYFLKNNTKELILTILEEEFDSIKAAEKRAKSFKRFLSERLSKQGITSSDVYSILNSFNIMDGSQIQGQFQYQYYYN
jgi:hypothetical protein